MKEKTVSIMEEYNGFNIKIVYPSIPHTTRQEEEVYVHFFSKYELEELRNQIVSVLKGEKKKEELVICNRCKVYKGTMREKSFCCASCEVEIEKVREDERNE